jgi:hypothetical protein
MLGVDMNVLELNNVEVHPKVSSNMGGDKVEDVWGPMKVVVAKLAALNPLWRFVVTDCTASSKQATAFEVRDGGEKIGNIGRTYFRGDYCINISNDRISENMQRGNGYKTSDPQKAILKAKKMFSRLKPSERITKAHSLANDVMHKQERNKMRDQHTAYSKVKQAAMDFIMGTGFDLFLAHVQTLPESTRASIETARKDQVRLDIEMLTIEKIREKFSDNKTALVIRDTGNYLVRIGQDVQMYDDNTLPDNMRGKLGMLKLVEAEHFISSVGCRINDEIFVIVTEEN